MKYLLPKELGGGECELLTDHAGPDDTVDVLVGGRLTIEIGMPELTPLVPPTPEEPPPGAYLIGGLNCLRLAFEDREEPYWVVDHDRQSGWWFTWEELWTNFGGIDVKVQRLVPEPPRVELPWHYATWTIRDDGDGEVTISVGGRHYGLAHAGAREMAAALLTAAGEPC